MESDPCLSGMMCSPNESRLLRFVNEGKTPHNYKEIWPIFLEILNQQQNSTNN